MFGNQSRQTAVYVKDANKGTVSQQATEVLRPA
jgi:hypothetical protein